MISDNTIIGVWCDYECNNPATFADLKKAIGKTSFNAEQYCDYRCNTNLRQFKYEPYTGKLIDWKEVLRLLKQ